MKEELNLRIAFDAGCLRSLRKVPDRVNSRFMEMVLKVMSDPSRNGLNIEPVEGAKDKGVKSVRVDQAYRSIAYLAGRDLLFLHVDEHDKAYRWATNRSVQADPATQRVRIFEAAEEVEATAPAPQEPFRQDGLFDGHDDAELLQLGVMKQELPRIRRLVTEAELVRDAAHFDATTHDILSALAAGFAPEEIPALIGIEAAEGTAAKAPAEIDFADALRTEESRKTIFIPESEAELRRVLDGDLEDWRVFLHPQQRRLAYRSYNGPVLVRGGAGTGKTVVAMHRARHLADLIAKDPARTGEKVLFTTFTSNLARDIEANLRRLCPEHLKKGAERIEVENLDGWVGGFLRRRNFDRKIAYFGDDLARLEEIWDEVFSRHACPDGLSQEFVRNEWTQVVQAQGIDSRPGYFKASRAGRGTPLDRRRRAALWPLFEAYRARMLDEGLAEPDDAYREAITLLQGDGAALPYAAVVVDEAQDMGEQAFRLVRAIVPKKPSGDRDSIFIVGDAHQRIYARRASLSACGIEVRGRSRRLRLNYRTTDDIRRWAVGILEGVAVDDLDEGIDSLAGYSSLMHGPAPDCIGYDSRDAEIAGLVEWIRQHEGENGALATIGVLARTRFLLKKVEDALHKAGLQTVRLSNNKADDQRVPGVRLATMHRAKGLEFHAVAIVFLDKAEVPPKAALKAAVDEAGRRETIEREKSLLHVAATRAKKFLRVSWSGEPAGILPG